MIHEGDIHVTTNVNYSLETPFTVNYHVMKFGENTYINILFTHNGLCEFYEYKLDGNIIKLYYKEDDVLKYTDILLIYL